MKTLHVMLASSPLQSNFFDGQGLTAPTDQPSYRTYRARNRNIMLRLFIVESPNPLDEFEGRSEAQALKEVARLMGHQVVCYQVRSAREFEDTLKHLASADSRHAAAETEDAPLILHIACHGNKASIAIGPDSLRWPALMRAIEPVLCNHDYGGRTLVSLAACGSSGHTLNTLLSDPDNDREKIRLPPYIFSIDQKATCWDESLMAWSLLYLKLGKGKIDWEDGDAVRRALNDIYQATSVPLKYHRLAGKRYLKFVARRD